MGVDMKVIVSAHKAPEAEYKKVINSPSAIALTRLRVRGRGPPCQAEAESQTGLYNEDLCSLVAGAGVRLRCPRGSWPGVGVVRRSGSGERCTFGSQQAQPGSDRGLRLRSAPPVQRPHGQTCKLSHMRPPPPTPPPPHDDVIFFDQLKF